MSQPAHEQDSLREAFVALSGAAAGTPGCPEPEAIWRALMGEAPSGEARSLIDHTVECGACAESWRLGRSIALEAGLLPVAAQAKPGIGRWLGIAAAVLLVAVAVTLLGRDRRADPWQEITIAKAVYEPPAAEEDLLWRGPGAGTADQAAGFAEAMKPYGESDFTSAEQRLAAFLEMHPDHVRALLYRGVCLLMLDRPAEAATSLESAATTAEPLLRDEAEWYLAIAEGRAGKGPRGIERLRSIATGPSAHGEEARSLLERLGEYRFLHER